MLILLSALSASFANKNEQNVATPNNLIIKFQTMSYHIRYNIQQFCNDKIPYDLKKTYEYQ